MYHYSQNGKVQGPVAPDRLIELFDAGTVRPHDPVRLDGTATWRAAIDIVASLRAEPFSVSPSFVGKRKERTRMLGTPQGLSPAPEPTEPPAAPPRNDTVRTFLDFSRNMESVPLAPAPEKVDARAHARTDRQPPSFEPGVPSRPPPDPFGVTASATEPPRFGFPSGGTAPGLFGETGEPASPAPVGVARTRTLPVRLPPGVPDLVPTTPAAAAEPASEGALAGAQRTLVVKVPEEAPVLTVEEAPRRVPLRPPPPLREDVAPVTSAQDSVAPLSAAPIPAPLVLPAEKLPPLRGRASRPPPRVSPRPSSAPIVARPPRAPTVVSLPATKLVVAAVVVGALAVAAVLFGRYTTDLRGALPPVGTRTTTETTLILSSGRVTLKRGASSAAGTVALDAQTRVLGTLASETSLVLRYQKERAVRTLHLSGQPPSAEAEDGVLSGRTVLVTLGEGGKKTLEGEPPTEAQLPRIAGIVADARAAYPVGRVWPGQTWSVDPRYYCYLLSLDDGCTGSAQMELSRFVRYRGERSVEIEFHASVRGHSRGLDVDVTLSGRTYRSLERFLDLDTHGGGILRMSGEVPAGIDGKALMDLEGPFELTSKSVQDTPDSPPGR